MNRTLSQFSTDAGGRLVGADVRWSGVCIDSRKVQPGDLFIALRGEHVDGHDYVAAAAAAGAVGALVERLLAACAMSQVVVANVEQALQQAAAAHRLRFSGPVVAVAGSNGKTTTKELVRSILARRWQVLATRGNLNNHLGVPLTLLSLDATHEAAVIEVGANHPGEVAFLTTLVRPQVGLVTNAGAEHLEGFGSLEGVARAEGELFAGLANTATAVINADDEFAGLWNTLCGKAQRMDFGFGAAVGVRIVNWDAGANGVQTFTLITPAGEVSVRLPLLGRHNAVNAAGAAAAALAAGASLEEIAAGLAAVKAVPGRLVMHTALGGARLIDDTYNANPSSVAVGLDLLASYGGERWLVLGEMGELGEHTAAAHTAAGELARVAGVSRLFALGAPTKLSAVAFGIGAECHTSSEALTQSLVAALRAHDAPHELTVYVKGSRMNRLEKVVAAVLAGQAEGVTNAA
jgi:UDP-N-acetylmuramoyl-tripeptide--D-alanyl-D-alanine ligase